MAERKSIYYGQVQIIPGVMCDGYVLNDPTAVLSGRGTADLLNMDVYNKTDILRDPTLPK